MENAANFWGPFAKFSYEQAYAGIHDSHPKAKMEAVFIVSWDQISKQDYDLYAQRKIK